ncbi:MAG: hypothetical protein ACD_41C00031G0004 [uncultured bacterium]|nr:MAG: hypothetical protein ACD_41C00031G0004 [uncultured bacterium]HBY73872.1 hypothetical protein [Candidatus Kerfeldbacteria bacterium]
MTEPISPIGLPRLGSRERRDKSMGEMISHLTLETLPDEQQDIVERALKRMGGERSRSYFNRDHDRLAAEALLQSALEAVRKTRGWKLGLKEYDITLLYASLDHRNLDKGLLALHHGAGLVVATIHDELRERGGGYLAELNTNLAQASHHDATLERKAMYNKKTGLHNDPDTVRDRFVAERDRLLREGTPDEVMVVVEVDIMHFKELNSRFGNGVVDQQVLAPLGKELQDGFRSYDIRCHFGGDEFTLILSRVKQNEVNKMLKHIQAVVENCRYGEKITANTIQARIGAVVFTGDDLKKIPTVSSKDFVDRLRERPLLAAEEVKRRMTRGDHMQIAVWDETMTADKEIAWEVWADTVMRANSTVMADLRNKFGDVAADVFKENLRKAIAQTGQAAAEHEK